MVAAPLASYTAKLVLVSETPGYTRWRGSGLDPFVYPLIVTLFLWCFWAFILAAIIQFVIGWRRESLVSAAYAGFSFIIYIIFITIESHAKR